MTGKCSWFGGPEDDGVSPDEGLAFIYKVEDAPHLFSRSSRKARQGWLGYLILCTLHRVSLEFMTRFLRRNCSTPCAWCLRSTPGSH